MGLGVRRIGSRMGRVSERRIEKKNISTGLAACNGIFATITLE